MTFPEWLNKNNYYSIDEFKKIHAGAVESESEIDAAYMEITEEYKQYCKENSKTITWY